MMTIVEAVEERIKEEADQAANQKKRQIVDDLCALMQGYGLDGTMEAGGIAHSAAHDIVRALAAQDVRRRKQMIVDRLCADTAVVE